MDYIPNRWANEKDQSKGLAQIRILQSPTYYPLLIVFQWIGTTDGPYFDYVVVTMDHFPEEKNRLQYLTNAVVKIKMNLIDLAASL
jgi:hypothetical protein